MARRKLSSFTLSAAATEKLAVLAEAAGLSRSRMVEQLIMGREVIAAAERNRLVQQMADNPGPSVKKVRRRLKR